MPVQAVADVLRSVGGQAIRLADHVAETVEQAAFGPLRRGFDRLDLHGRAVREGVGAVEDDDAVFNMAGQ
jgi:hypothetical protein